MAAPPLADRVVEVLCDHGPSADPRWTVGSGLLFGGTHVLTAAHAVEDGALTIRTVGKAEYPATVALAGSTDGIDLAVLDVPRGLAALPPLEFARVARDLPTAQALRDCWAVGFPKFQTVVGADGVEVRATAQVDGRLPLADDLGSGMLTLHVENSPRRLPPQEEELGNSSWSGMSGAAVFAGDRIVGVVTEHSPRRGDQTVTLTPITFVDRLPDAGSWWRRLGTDPDRIATLPDRPDVTRYLEVLEATLDQDPWTRAASSAGRTLSLSGIARPAAVQVVRRDGPAGTSTFDPMGTAKEWQRLVVLGEPGTGKSWLARRLAILAAQRARQALETGIDPEAVELPLFASIADVTTKDSAWSGVVEACLSTVRHQLDGPAVELLRTRFNGPRGPYLLVLDGLDEAGAGFDERILGWIPGTPGLNARLVLTSRPGAWTNQLPLDGKNPGHHVVELSPLEYPADVLAVIDGWLGDQPENRDRLVRLLAARAELAEAARTPLLCAMLCLLAESPEGIPSRRRELYRRLVTRLLRGEWRPGARATNYEPARQALRHLASAGAVDDPGTGLAEWPDAVAVPLPVPLSEQAMSWVTHVAPPQRYDPDADPQPRRFVHRSIREYLLAEHLATLPVVDAAIATEQHLWFDVSWEPVVPAAVAGHPQRDELLRRLVSGDDRAVTEADLAARDGFGELRRLLVRVAAESSPADWQPDTRELIEQACATLRRYGVADRLLVADNGWKGALPEVAEIDQLVLGDFSWRGPEVTTWVRRLRLQGRHRRRVLRALTRMLVTGQNEAGAYEGQKAEDAARALVALDPRPAELAEAVQGLAERMRRNLDADKARAFRLLGGTMDRSELLEIVENVRQHELFDSFPHQLLDACTRGLGELDAPADVRERAAALLLEEAERGGTSDLGLWVTPLAGLHPGPVTAARAVAILIASAEGRDSGDRRSIMSDLDHLARDVDDPAATLLTLVGRYGPWENRDVAEAALTALVHRCPAEDRRAAIHELVQRLRDSRGWDTYSWAKHLTALTPAAEPDAAAADALIEQLLETTVRDSYYLLVSLEEVVANDEQRCAVLTYLQDQLRGADEDGLRLEICRRARPFLTTEFDHSEFVEHAVASAEVHGTSLADLEGALRDLPLSDEVRSRALRAVIGRLPGLDASAIWEGAWAIESIAPLRTPEEQHRLVQVLVGMLREQPTGTWALLGVLDKFDAMVDPAVADVAVQPFLSKPVQKWDLTPLTSYVPRMALSETHRTRMVALLLESLRSRGSLFLPAQEVRLIEELDPEGRYESAVTELLLHRVAGVHEIGAGLADEMVQREVLPLLAERVLDQGQRARVIAACIAVVGLSPSSWYWVIPTIRDIGPDTNDRRALLAAVEEGIRSRAVGIPSGLPAALRELTSPGPDAIRALIAAFRAAQRRERKRSSSVVYSPGTPDRDLPRHLVDLGLTAVEAFIECLPDDPGAVAPNDEYTFRELARETRHGASYEEWVRALPTWAALDTSLYVGT
jgi:hypothetical protein